jgi:hypothetical protein
VASSTSSKCWSATTETDSLRLAPAEAEILSTELSAFAAALPDAAARARYTRLASCAAEGRVPAELLPALETMLELALQRGGPTARQALLSVFSKTPRGRALGAAAREVNRALQALGGQTLQSVRVSSGPGTHSLSIETDRCRLTLDLDSHGAHITSLEAG